MNSFDELAHAIGRHVVGQLADSQRPCFAHIASYNAALHSVRVIIPSLRDEFDTPVLSGWIPFASPSAGGGGGLQYHPLTGATQADPTAGEQCQIGFFDPRIGLSAVGGLHFNAQTPTPASLLPNEDPLKPGETVIAQKSGNYVRIRADGGIDHASQTAVRLGNIETMLQLLLDQRAIPLLNGHTHNGGPPMDQKLAIGDHTTMIAKAN